MTLLGCGDGLVAALPEQGEPGGVLADQVLRSSLLDDLATLQHDHLVGVHGIGQGVGDDHGGAAGRQTGDGLQHLALVLGVQSGGGLSEQANGG